MAARAFKFGALGFKVCWGLFVIFGWSCSGILVVFLGSFLGSCCRIVGDLFGFLLVYVWGLVVVCLWSFWGSCCGLFWGIFAEICDRFGVLLCFLGPLLGSCRGLFWGHFGVFL